MTEATPHKNIYQRLAGVMDEVTYIQKERKQGMNYTIVSHDAVTAKVRPALLKHGIIYHPVRCEHLQNGNRAECSLTVRFVNVDNPSDFFEVPTFGYGIDPQDKGPGKAMSYAVKYALLKALGLETGDDPDMDSIDHSPNDNHAGKASLVPRKPSVTNAPVMTPAMQSLWDELTAINSSRGLQIYWGDNAKAISDFAPPFKGRFIAKKDELKAKFDRTAETLMAGE